jgi:antirestriction protein ArdC
MSFSQAQLDALDAAIASGALRVTYDGQTVEYRSIDDLMKARALVVRERAGARRNFYNPAYDRGTD